MCGLALGDRDWWLWTSLDRLDQRMSIPTLLVYRPHTAPCCVLLGCTLIYRISITPLRMANICLNKECVYIYQLSQYTRKDDVFQKKVRFFFGSRYSYAREKRCENSFLGHIWEFCMVVVAALAPTAWFHAAFSTCASGMFIQEVALSCCMCMEALFKTRVSWIAFA